jgi:molecular chaperone HscC
MVVGIDLGTTHSLVSIWRDGRAVVIANAMGVALTPSVVGLDDSDTVLVGAAARERLVTHPQHTAATFKRNMGSTKEWLWRGKKFRAEDLSALVLKSLKADAEAFLGEPVTEAVITVPAYFNDTQRKATRIAGELAGLKVERLLNEPTAAALAYGLHDGGERTFLVFDLGGGTFDISVLEIFDGVIEVHASAGDNFLGGEDFSEVIAQWFISHEKLDTKSLTPLERASLSAESERAKRKLSEAQEALFTVTIGGVARSATLSRAGFEELAAPLLQRLRTPIERALRDAKFKAADIEQIVLVGGATRMPMIPQLVTRMFSKLPLRTLNPDEVVAMGAAVQAGLKARDAALKEVVLTDVSPYSLGVAVHNKNDAERLLFSPIIERNTTIPASREESYSPVHPEQTVIKLGIFQGEARYVAENIELGSIEVAIPKTGKRDVLVRFTYDINGLLEVEATVEGTGKQHRLVIQQNPGVLSDAEIAERLAALAKLKIHPRDQDENRAAVERAKRVYEECLGDARQYAGQLLERFEGALASQETRKIDAARVELLEALNQLEGGGVW